MPENKEFDNRLNEQNMFITPGLQYREFGEAPEQFVLPSHDELVELSKTPDGQAKLIAILEHFGLCKPLELAKARAIAESYTLQALPYGSQEWEDRYEAILDRYTGAELMGMTRQVNERYTSLQSIDGNPDTEMVWLTEDDERVCEYCDDRAGEIRTWAEWQALGPPGVGCLGGAACRCDLVQVGE